MGGQNPMVEEPEPEVAAYVEFLHRLSRSKSALIGSIVLGLLVLLAITAPWLTQYDPIEIDATTVFQRPSLKFPMGTDYFGRDILTRILYGARISLVIGLVATGVGACCGVALGLIAGYFGGLVDDIIGRIVDTLLAFPGILLALMMIIILGPGLFNVMIAVGFSRIPQFTRLVRGEVLGVRETEYVISAEASGANALRIMFRHILPNILAPVMVLATLGVGTAVLSAAGLGYLGLGAQPPTPEWGLMLSESREFIRYAWWVMTFPGIAIVVTVIAVNLLGDGLRDVLDPRLRGSR